MKRVMTNLSRAAGRMVFGIEAGDDGSSEQNTVDEYHGGFVFLFCFALLLTAGTQVCATVPKTPKLWHFSFPTKTRESS